MTCKTHIAAAAALSLMAVEPTTVPVLLTTIGAATIGGTLPDLDVATSDSHKYVDIFTILFVIGFIIIAFVEKFVGIGVLSWIKNNTSYLNFAVCFVLFLSICFFGMHRPHRSLLHSLLGFIIMSGLVYLGLGSVALPFSVGMASHIVLDLLNKKGIQLYYPLPGRYALKLFDSDGLVNKILFVFFIIVIVVRLFLIKG